MKKILYGICGIGNGHLYRQLPILKYFLSKKYQVLVFAYGNSFNYIKNYIADNKNSLNNLLEVVQVNVPYYIGNETGVDFVKSAMINQNNDPLLNLQAFAFAQQWLGRPDLVISDYEPFCAQYGYSYNTKVVTIDQQSKYLLDYLPQPLEDTYYNDETMRLRMFFPVAEKRLIASFFKIEKYQNNDYVYIVPPLIRKEVLKIKNIPDYAKKDYIVYLTSQEGYIQSLDSVLNSLLATLSKNANIGCFHVFLKDTQYNSAKKILEKLSYHNNSLKIYKHGNKEFEKLLKHCLGIITTAGHTLVSEAMHLGIPIYALPLKLYEQQLTAKIIHDNQFGIKFNEINTENLKVFTDNIDQYRLNINNDIKVLFKHDGLNFLLDELNFLL